MGGGGQSTTTTQIPASLQQLWTSTTNQITPIQKQMWQTQYTDASGNPVDPAVIATSQARRESLQKKAATEKGLSDVEQAELDKLSTEQAGWTASPNQFTTQQDYEQFYGKPGEGTNYIPDTAYAALEQALGGGGQSGFTEESKWAAPAAVNAMNVANAPAVGAEFTQEHPAQVVNWNPGDLRLANYAGVGGAQFTNPQPAGNPDPYAPTSQQAPSNLFSTGLQTQTPQQASSNLFQTPGQTAGQTGTSSQPQYAQAAAQGGSYKPQASQNTPAVQSTGNAAGWMDVTKPAYETGYVSQANQLQNIGAGTPNLEQLARSTEDPNSLAGNALKVWANTKLPTLQNQAALMGLGRSGALIKNIDSSQNQFLLPIMQQQMDYENQAIGRAQQGATSNVSALQTASQAQQAREAQDYTRNMDQASIIRAHDQATLDAQQADFLRRQALSQQGATQQAQNAATAGGMFQNLAQQDTARQMQAANQLVGMAQTEKDWAAQPGDFAYQEFLRTQGLGENMLFQPLGGAASAVGTTVSGGK